MARKRKEIKETTYTYWGWDKEKKEKVPLTIIKAGEESITQEHIVILYNADKDIENQNDKIKKHTDYSFEQKRKRAQDANCDEVFDPMNELPDTRSDIPNSNAKEIKLLLDRLSIHMEKLTDKQREFIYQYYGQGLSFAEIARRDGVTEGAVRHRNTKIIHRLKKLFDEDEPK